MLKFIYVTELILLMFIADGCATKKVEYVMPFYNLEGYGADRLLPLALSNDTLALRIWINNGTSVERVISITSSEDSGTRCFIDEFSKLGKEKKQFYRHAEITPKSGITYFLTELQSLNLFSLKDQNPKDFHPAMHKPFSLYIVEFKKHGKYHCFKFNTLYPYDPGSDAMTVYTRIENIIRQEFRYKFYFK